ncbi:DUF29 domain-containing protein [Methylobacterium fujisawaense]
MDRPSLYDDDIVTWAEEQVAALRALGARSDLSNAVDWENVAEEIESVGRSQLRAVEGLLVQALAHMLKRLSAPDLPVTRPWREETLTFQIAARNRFERSMRQRLDWDRIWKSAGETANLGLTPYGDGLLPNLPDSCPVDPDELLSARFDMDAILLQIAESRKHTPSL